MQLKSLAIWFPPGQYRGRTTIIADGQRTIIHEV